MKKKIAIILAVSALVTSSLVSCGGEKMPPKEKVDHVYKTTEVDIGNISYASEILTVGDEIIIRANKILNQEEGTVERHIIRLSTDGEVKSDEVMAETPERTNIINQLIADQSGKLYAVMYQYTDEGTLFSLRSFDGTSVGDTIIEDIGSLFVEEVDTSNRPWMSGFYLQGAAVDHDGNFIFASETAIVATDRDGNKLFEATLDNGDMRDLASASDGRVFITYMDYENYDNVVCEIDTEKGRIDDPISMPSGNDDIRNADFYFAPGHDAYYKTDVGVYSLDFDETGAAGEPQLLLDFVNSDLIANELQEFGVINGERMIAMSYQYDEGSQTSSSTVFLLDRVPDEEVQEKYVLELALKYANQTVTQRVVRFNRSSDEYRVKISLWNQRDEESQNYNLGEDLLGQRILSGDVPDIIAISDFSKGSEWATAGSFADMNEMMKKDESFDRSKVFMNVIQKFESAGKLYTMPVNCYIMTLLAKRSNIPFDGWTPSEYIEYAKGLGDGQYMMNYGGKMQTLSTLLNNSLTRFVNRAEGTCDFDNDDFRAMLEFSASQPDDFNFYDSLSGDDLMDYQSDRNKMYRDNRVILDSSYIYDVASMLNDEVSVGAGEEVVFVGYPCYEGNGAVLSASESYAVFNGSQLKDGAWEFVKSAVLSETTGRYGRDSFPISRDAFDKMMAAYSDQHYFFYYDGGYSGWSGEDGSSHEDDNSGIQRDVTQSDIDRIKALIDGSTAMPDIDQKAAEMIMEEVQNYFAGDKPLDETVKVIQSRVGIYLAEKQ